MRLTNKHRRQFAKIWPFALIWLIFAIVYSLLEKGILGESATYPSTGNQYEFASSLIIISILATMTGFIQGFIEVTYLQDKFNNRGFVAKVIFKAFLYLIGIILFLLVSTIISNSIRLNRRFYDPEVWHTVYLFFSNFVFWSIVIFIGVIIVFTLFLAEIGGHIGQGVMLNFIFGKYFKPQNEERIFMFLDMKASTTIAEKIGHERYFDLLKMYYGDMADTIIETEGEIYQYVGDEIVISWKMKKGLSALNCIRCFYFIKEAFQKESEKYRKTFNTIPGFKAGVHCGMVTYGEIGKLKQDILYTGDVLNTTARIQSKCNDLQAELLISEDLKTHLNGISTYRLIDKGIHDLRGRNADMRVFEVQPVR
jgi:adenylate cyclase